MHIEIFKKKFFDTDGVNLYNSQSDHSKKDISNNDGIFNQNDSKSKIKELTLRLFSLLNHNNYQNHTIKSHLTNQNLIHKYQNAKLIQYLESVHFSNQNDYDIDNLNDKQSKISTAIYVNEYLSSTQSSNLYYTSTFNDINYNKNNELYSIFVSMFTAALFVFFIMWRWLKMKSDLRKALREQYEIQRQQRLNSDSFHNTPPTTPASTLTNVSPSSLHQNHFFASSNYRENLNILLNQLNNGETRSNRQNQQIIDAAKYCLQQLRYQSRNTNRNLYSLNQTSSFDINGQTASFQIQPIIENFNSTSSIMNIFNRSSNESPPSYDSIMKKSSSLPSYYHLTLK
ncbi:unnamed protein product [Brachionus calyciflorus]|uniref:Uncharacterized protein n=1 Tax=Brachionus calyciflorus TaxID=104777 RepID=A0A814L338_9BILA|nr:unnamed protein product [Brachionus calyciflorus]